MLRSQPVHQAVNHGVGTSTSKSAVTSAEPGSPANMANPLPTHFPTNKSECLFSHWWFNSYLPVRPVKRIMRSSWPYTSLSKSLFIFISLHGTIQLLFIVLHEHPWHLKVIHEHPIQWPLVSFIIFIRHSLTFMAVCLIKYLSIFLKVSLAWNCTFLMI